MKKKSINAKNQSILSAPTGTIGPVTITKNKIILAVQSPAHKKRKSITAKNP